MQKLSGVSKEDTLGFIILIHLIDLSFVPEVIVYCFIQTFNLLSDYMTNN